MGVVANPVYVNGQSLKANTADTISGSNAVGLNDILSDALSLSQLTSQTLAGPLLLSGAVTANGSVTLNAATINGTGTINGPATFAGTVALNGNVTFGAGSLGHVTIISTAGPYSVAAADRYLIVTFTSTGSITLTLPATPTTGRLLTIKDGGSAGTHNITITGSQNIDTSTTLTLNQNFASVDLIYTGTIWVIL